MATDIPTSIAPQLHVQAEPGDIRAQNKLRGLTNQGWVSNTGWTHLQFAAANGFVKVFGMLAQERGQDLHARQGDGWTLLHWAAFNGHIEVARLLVHEFKAHV